MGIRTIGQLAAADPVFLKQKLGRQGETIWQFANGRDTGELQTVQPANKGYGNSYTTPCDVTTRAFGRQVLLSLCETVGMRMLTGDRESVARSVAAKLGVDEVHAELLPEDKVAAVEELLKQTTGQGRLLFVGDGVNDAPVLSRADIGVAMSFSF